MLSNLPKVTQSNQISGITEIWPWVFQTPKSTALTTVLTLSGTTSTASEDLTYIIIIPKL